MADLDTEWARVDRRWWELDREWEALRRRVTGGSATGNLYLEMNRVLQRQEAAIRRMDELLEEFAGYTRGAGR
jgi:hypothetical protein